MPRRSRHLLPLTLLLGGVALAAVSLVPGPSCSGGDRDAHLDFRRTYAEALLEARARNVPVFVSRHKDD